MSATTAVLPAVDAAVSALIYQEGLLIDQKRWSDWIELYTEDAVFWMPSWKSESETTEDPEYELNLLYLKGRSGLEDRVFRIDSGDSFASVPLDRTTHIIGGVLVTGRTASGELVAAASWLVHSYGMRGTATRGGRYEFLLRDTDEGLRIARKKIVMIDDRLEGSVDVYHV